jgi:hypothetical protein
MTIEYSWAEDRPERLPELAQDLVLRNVEVIVTSGYAPRAAPTGHLDDTDRVRRRYRSSCHRPGAQLPKTATLPASPS